MTFGIVTAMDRERRTLSRAAGSGSIKVAVSGIGSANAAAAASSLISEGVDFLLTWGVAGALRADLAPGDVVVPKTVLDSSGVAYETEASWNQRFRMQLEESVRCVPYPLVSANHVVATAAEKQQLAAVTGAGAVDMESAAVARVAAANNVPFVAVRAISDSLSMEIPGQMLHAADDRGRVRPLALIAGVIRRPVLVRALIRLGAGMRRAERSLRSASHILAFERGSDAPEAATLIAE